jgi:hypothetical protein
MHDLTASRERRWVEPSGRELRKRRRQHQAGEQHRRECDRPAVAHPSPLVSTEGIDRVRRAPVGGGHDHQEGGEERPRVVDVAERVREAVGEEQQEARGRRCNPGVEAEEQRDRGDAHSDRGGGEEPRRRDSVEQSKRSGWWTEERTRQVAHPLQMRGSVEDDVDADDDPRNAERTDVERVGMEHPTVDALADRHVASGTRRRETGVIVSCTEPSRVR